MDCNKSWFDPLWCCLLDNMSSGLHHSIVVARDATKDSHSTIILWLLKIYWKERMKASLLKKAKQSKARHGKARRDMRRSFIVCFAIHKSIKRKFISWYTQFFSCFYSLEKTFCCFILYVQGKHSYLEPRKERSETPCFQIGLERFLFLAFFFSKDDFQWRQSRWLRLLINNFQSLSSCFRRRLTCYHWHHTRSPLNKLRGLESGADWKMWTCGWVYLLHPPSSLF